MTSGEALQLLERFRAGQIPRDKVLRAFQAAPVADLGFAQVDTHRALRKGFPEVIFGAGKTPAQVVKIAGQAARPRTAGAGHPRHRRTRPRPCSGKFKHAVHHQNWRAA